MINTVALPVPERILLQDEITNLDGVSVKLEKWQRKWLWNIHLQYPIIYMLRGTVGWSELGIHCRIAENQGIIVLTDTRGRCGYVLDETGTITPGCLCIFSNNTFSLS